MLTEPLVIILHCQFGIFYNGNTPLFWDPSSDTTFSDIPLFFSCTPWFRHPIVPTLHEHCSNYKFSIKCIQCQRNLLIMFRREGVAGTGKKREGEFSKLPTKIKKGPFLSTIDLICSLYYPWLTEK